VFLIGAARSGSTWLQQMLGAHPSIVSPQELSLFGRYVKAWERLWQVDTELIEFWPDRRVKGLTTVFTTEEMQDLLTRTIWEVYARVWKLKPGATVLLDKDPSNSKWVHLILRHLPDARFIHLIRDGRDVAASLVAAAEGWGDHWAPSTVHKAARRWRHGVNDAREASRATDRYVEVRYEDLLTTGPDVLAQLFAFCGVETERAQCECIYDRFSLERMASSGESSIVIGGEAQRVFRDGYSEPEGFFGEGRPGVWKKWGPNERDEFDQAAGRLLRRLGYVSGHEWVDGGSV
jgi:hypothetical protein